MLYYSYEYYHFSHMLKRKGIPSDDINTCKQIDKPPHATPMSTCCSLILLPPYFRGKKHRKEDFVHICEVKY